MKRFKDLVLLGSAVLLIATTVFVTVAYLTDSAQTVNTFTIGQVDIGLDEALVNVNGEPIGTERTADGNEYHLIPGGKYTKDPTVTVIKGSEEAYIRMLVTINCYSQLATIYGEPFLPQNFVEGWKNNVWVSTGEIKKDTATNTAIYEFRYYKTVTSSKTADTVLEPLFEKIVVPFEITGKQLESIADLEITVEAHAIQKEGFETDSDAWAAFKK